MNRGGDVLRTLVASFIFPYPPNCGGSRDIYSRISAIVNAGHQVDVVATTRRPVSEEEIAGLKRVADNVIVLHRSRRPTDLLSFVPFQCATRSGLKRLNLARVYDAVILESEFMGPILQNSSLRARTVVMRVHNDEPALYRALAHSAAKRTERLLFWLEGVKLRYYRKSAIDKCQQLWFISDEELNSFQEQNLVGNGSISLHHVPVVIDPSHFRTRSLVSTTVVYAGALDIATNRAGLLWYLKNVHPEMLSVPEYRLHIAGRTNQRDIADLLGAVKCAERASISLNLESLEELYEGAGAYINPIQEGAGVKVKSLDAVTSGLPLVTTTVGAEGTSFVHGKDAIIVDDPLEFANGIRKILLDKEFAREMVRNGQETLRNRNSAQAFLRIISGLPRNDEAD